MVEGAVIGARGTRQGPDDLGGSPRGYSYPDVPAAGAGGLAEHMRDRQCFARVFRHRDLELLDVIDSWVCSLAPDTFIAISPLLRRTFGSFETAERRQLGMLLASQVVVTGDGFGAGIDEPRAAAGLATVRQMLGVPL